MGLETGTYVADLVTTNPTSSDVKSAGDDHLRLLKVAVANTIQGWAGTAVVTGTDGGAVNAYTLTPTLALAAYGTRMLALFSPTVTNSTTTPTLNISGLGAKSLKRMDGNAPAASEFVSGEYYLAMYTGTEFRLMHVSKQYIDQLAFGTALPSQTGNADEGLTTDGTNASWTPMLKYLPVSNDVDQNITLGSTPGEGTPRMVAIALDATRDLLIFGNITSCHAIVYNNSTAIFGSPVLVRTANISLLQGIKTATDQAMVVTCNTTTGVEHTVLSIAASVITVGTPTATVLAGNITSGNDSDLIADLNGTSWVWSYRRATTVSGLRAITISGTTPTVGAESTVSGTSTTPTLYQVSSGVVLSISSTATTLYADPFTVTGSTLGAGTGATITVSSATWIASALATRWAVIFKNTQMWGVIINVSVSTATTSIVQLSAGTYGGSLNAMTISSQVIAAVSDTSALLASFNVLTDVAGVATAGTEIIRVTGTTAAAIGVIGVYSTTLRMGANDSTSYVTISGNNPAVTTVPHRFSQSLATSVTPNRKSDYGTTLLSGTTISAVATSSSASISSLILASDGTKGKIYAMPGFAGRVGADYGARKAVNSIWTAQPISTTVLRISRLVME